MTIYIIPDSVMCKVYRIFIIVSEKEIFLALKCTLWSQAVVAHTVNPANKQDASINFLIMFVSEEQLLFT